jgi:hypothetical protein
MNEHKEVVGFGKSSWQAEKSSWAASIGLGALIAAAGFTLVLWAVAWFIPKFLLFTQSRWARLLPAISIFFISISGLVHLLRKRRSNNPRRTR